MPRYAAMLRGVGPANPELRNDRLQAAFERLGFDNVRPVISSGNVVFESGSRSGPALEKKIESALPATTMVRSREQLRALVESDPFGGREHGRTTHLNVTFLKREPDVDWAFPYRPEGKSYEIVGIGDRAVFSVIDLTGDRTPDLMAWLERQFGKEITTRTFATVQRLLAKLE